MPMKSPDSNMTLSRGDASDCPLLSVTSSGAQTITAKSN